MKPTRLLLFLKLAVTGVALYATTSALAGTSPTTALGGLDPVELTRGKEIKGNEDLAATRGRYRYCFASAGNKQQFESRPAEYAIQFDGYCMKMGPLSGRGDPERFYVNDQRIYLFASEGCRNGFKADPAAFTDLPDAPPTGTEAEKKRGTELLNRAMAGFGGADKVDALKSYRSTTKTVHAQNDEKIESSRVLTIAFPDRMRVDESWGKSTYGHALANGAATEITAEGVEALPADVRDCVVRRLYREPLAILRARNEPGFIVVAAGHGEVNGTAVEWVKTAYAGATTTLGVDPANGRILELSYRGRAPSKMGEVRKTYSEFRKVEDDMIVPFDVQVSYDGKPSSQPKPDSRAVVLNLSVDGAWFPKPD